jgi:hypothetical protein
MMSAIYCHITHECLRYLGEEWVLLSLIILMLLIIRLYVSIAVFS